MAQRILYMIDSLRVGGAETLLLDLLDAAAARGARTHVAYFTRGPLEREVAERGIGMTRLSRAGLRDPRALWRAIRLIRDWNPDVLHTHLTKSDLVGQFAARFAPVGRRALTHHNIDPWRRNRLLSAIYRAATATADLRFAVSQQVADFVEGCGSAGRGQVTVIANGVDLARFDPAATRAMDLARWGVPRGARVAAVIGRLNPQKDHATFLEAAAIAARDSRAHFLIVGDGELREPLTRQAAGLGLTPGRLSFTGVVRDMPALLAAIDLLVFSSAWEGLPMTLLEGMAMGLPVAATRVGGIPGVIEDGREGILVPPGDAGALADAIGRILGDPARGVAMGEAGRARVRASFSGEAMIDRLFHAYEGTAATPLAGRMNHESQFGGTR